MVMRTLAMSFCTFLVFYFVACTEVELCKYVVHPHHSYLDFCFHWDEDYAENHSDSMMVIAVRPMNVMRYDFRVTAKETGNKGIMLSPDEERMKENDYEGEDGKIHQSTNDVLWVRPGIYKFVAFAIESEAYEDCFEVTDFINDETNEVNTDFSDLLITYRSFKVNDKAVTGKYGDWKSYNTYSDYISSFVNPVYMDHLNYIDVPIADEASNAVRLDFSPQPITQHVMFRMQIEKEEGVMVDSIIAEISGIPAAMELSTGLLRPEKSYKMLFKMGYPSLANREDSLHVSPLVCSGELETTGIVRSANESLQTGPGILSLAVYTHVLRKGVDGLSDRAFQKVFYAGINLFHTLTQTKLLEWDEEQAKYKQVCREAILDIGDILKIDQDRIVNGGSDNTGMDRWFDGENIILDI